MSTCIKLSYLQIVNENDKVFNVVEFCHFLFVVWVDEPEVLVGVGQDIKDEGRRVLQIHLRVLAVSNNL